MTDVTLTDDEREALADAIIASVAQQDDSLGRAVERIIAAHVAAAEAEHVAALTIHLMKRYEAEFERTDRVNELKRAAGDMADRALTAEADLAALRGRVQTLIEDWREYAAEHQAMAACAGDAGCCDHAHESTWRKAANALETVLTEADTPPTDSHSGVNADPPVSVAGEDEAEGTTGVPAPAPAPERDPIMCDCAEQRAREHARTLRGDQ